MIVTPEQFVTKWMEAHKLGSSQTWVASELTMSRQAVSQRARYMRVRGVNLPFLPRGKNTPARIPVGDLNEIVEFWENLE